MTTYDDLNQPLNENDFKIIENVSDLVSMSNNDPNYLPSNINERNLMNTSFNSFPPNNIPSLPVDNRSSPSLQQTVYQRLPYTTSYNIGYAGSPPPRMSSMNPVATEGYTPIRRHYTVECSQVGQHVTSCKICRAYIEHEKRSLYIIIGVLITILIMMYMNKRK